MTELSASVQINALKFQRETYQIIAALLLLLIVLGLPISLRDEAGRIDKMVSLDEVVNSSTMDLPIVWGNLGERLIASGVIDKQKFEDLLQQPMPQLVDGKSGRVTITRDNAGTVLNYLWALGLANKSKILEAGDMQKTGVDLSRFASLGAWRIGSGPALNHYSKHELIQLNDSQQALVDKLSRSIYRPCCNNSTHFPDCNHGMAMLGLLQLMVSQNFSEAEIYRTALIANAYWFGSSYGTINAVRSKWFGSQQAAPEILLRPEYSSALAIKKFNAIAPPLDQPRSSCALK